MPPPTASRTPFCTAATRLDSLRDPDKLRPWLYAIARNEALRCIRRAAANNPSDELPEATSSEPGPDALAARSDLAELVAQPPADCPTATARCWS